MAVDAQRNVGVIEFTFQGTHTGDLMELPPTGRAVEVPMLGIYELAGGQITRARLYYDAGTMMRQLGVGQ